MTERARSMTRLDLHTANDWPRPPRWIWVALLGGPVAWSLQLALGWFVAGASCMGDAPGWGALSANGVRATMVAIAVACVTLTLVALGLAWKAWRDSRNEGVLAIHADSRPEFLAATALLVSVLFLAAVAWTSVAQLLLPLCERIR